MRILVAEVDKVIRDQVLVGLESFGSVEVDAATGHEAVDLVRKREYDCIFVGMNQGDTSGPDLLDELKHLGPRIELIVISPEAGVKVVGQSRKEARVFSVLRKPLVPLEFYRTVSRLRKRLRTAGVA